MAVENEEVVRNLQSRIHFLGIDTSINMYPPNYGNYVSRYTCIYIFM